jgi:hypothetical protein
MKSHLLIRTTVARSDDINIPAVGTMSGTAKTIFQPIHESIRNKLDTEYVKLHDDILQYCAPSESDPWSADIRSRPSLIGFASPKLVEVGSVRDIDVDEYQVRVFTPESEIPNGGWPCFVYVSLSPLPIDLPALQREKI